MCLVSLVVADKGGIMATLFHFVRGTKRDQLKHHRGKNGMRHLTPHKTATLHKTAIPNISSSFPYLWTSAKCQPVLWDPNHLILLLFSLEIAALCLTRKRNKKSLCLHLAEDLSLWISHRLKRYVSMLLFAFLFIYTDWFQSICAILLGSKDLLVALAI